MSIAAGRLSPEKGTDRSVAESFVRRRSPLVGTLAGVYDYADDEVALVGWEPFVTRQWELIFSGYRSSAGLRRTGRRWADLLIGGGGLSEATADELVRAAVMDRPDLAPEDAFDPDDVRRRMLALLDLMADTAGGDSPNLTELVRVLHEFAGDDAS